MSWGMVAVAGATLVGNKLASDATKKGAESSTAAQLEGIQSQERMFDRSLEIMEPYRQAGYGALEGLQGMMSPEGRAGMLTDYYGGQEFAGYQQQAEEAVLRNAAATGGLRSGGTQSTLASIAPQLGADYLNQQQNLMFGLGNMGMGAASQGSQQASQLGSSIAQQQANIGNIQAQAAINQGNIWGNAAGTLGGIGYNYFNG